MNQIIDKVTGKINYRCGECGAFNCKLWRDYNTFLSHQSLYCLRCAAISQKKTIKDIDLKGKMHLKSEYLENMSCDQIGFLVPAVTTIEEDTFWGYASVPQDRCEWWWNLPIYAYAEEL